MQNKHKTLKNDKGHGKVREFFRLIAWESCSNECDEPISCFGNQSARRVVKLFTLDVFALGVSLFSWMGDDICMCVVNKQFELLKFVFD